ncbi:MAG: hypothetical protein ABI305_00795, partial [Tepidiformaceae bacterium]
MESRDRIAKVIEEFDAQGWHRTGTAVDVASGEWLRDQLRDAGVAANLETYPFTRLDIKDSHLRTQELRLEALPMFDGGTTTAEGVTGRLGLPGSGTEICLVTAHAGGPAPELEAAREGKSYTAVVSVAMAGRPGLAPRNAESY